MVAASWAMSLTVIKRDRAGRGPPSCRGPRAGASCRSGGSSCSTSSSSAIASFAHRGHDRAAIPHRKCLIHGAKRHSARHRHEKKRGREHQSICHAILLTRPAAASASLPAVDDQLGREPDHLGRHCVRGRGSSTPEETDAVVAVVVAMRTPYHLAARSLDQDRREIDARPPLRALVVLVVRAPARRGRSRPRGCVATSSASLMEMPPSMMTLAWSSCCLTSPVSMTRNVPNADRCLMKSSARTSPAFRRVGQVEERQHGDGVDPAQARPCSARYDDLRPELRWPRFTVAVRLPRRRGRPAGNPRADRGPACSRTG